MMKSAVTLACVLIIGSCSPSQKTAEPEPELPAFATLVGEHFGDVSLTETLLNEDESLAIVMQKGNWREGMPTGPFRFIVAKVDSAEILLEDQVANGSIKWLDLHNVELTMIPGIISGEEQGNRTGGYIFDCRDGSKKPRPQ